MNTPVTVLQDDKELERIVEIFSKLDRLPRNVLEIGSMYGGTLYQWISHMHPGGLVVAVDLLIPPSDYRHNEVMAGRALWNGWAKEAGITLHQIDGDSHSPDVIQAVAAEWPFDFIFIDGDHSYAGVVQDFENFYPMLAPGGIMAFHDVSCPDVNEHGIGSGTFWRELVSKGDLVTETMISTPLTWGIGLIYKPALPAVNVIEAPKEKVTVTKTAVRRSKRTVKGA